jgi:hypothetical protein
VYYGGETVAGTVTVSVQEETKSNGIRLTHRWRTHGRGNKDTGPEEVVTIAGPQVLLAGELLEVPFSVTASTHPVSYRGTMVNVDHYIRVDVDVPWARNPWTEEEYLLRPGQPPAQMTGARDQIVSLRVEPVQFGWIGKTIIGIIVFVFLGMIITFAFFLLPIILIVAAYFWVRKRAVAARVGTVEFIVPHRVVAPNEEWQATLKFTSRKSFSVNSISLQLTGIESATSGSGSNRKTHSHTVFSDRFVLRDSGPLMAGEAVDETLSITFPETHAFSLDQSDNSIKWSVEARIDIPSYPDWSEKYDLQVVPIEFLGDAAALPDATSGTGRTSYAAAENTLLRTEEAYDEDEDSGEADSGYTVSDTSPTPSYHNADAAIGIPQRGTTQESDDSVRSFSEPDSIEELLEQLTSVGRNNNLRNEVIATAHGVEMDVAVVIDRIVSSLGTMNTESGYQNGKTVTGAIEGTQQTIEITVPETFNAELESFRRGDIWQATITVTSWDNLYNRLRARHVL